MIPICTTPIHKYSNSAKLAIESGWISNHGEFTQKSITKFKEVIGSKHLILMANGTCATHCIFLALKYKYPNITKIYIPNNVYVAAWNSALMVYNSDMLEVMKMDINTWNIKTDDETIMSLDKNAAVLIVHNLGNIINVPRLKALRPDLIFVEDNCEGFTGKYDYIYTGTTNSVLCSSVSFYGNKIITTGEGGAFLTQDDDIYNYIVKAYSQGMSATRYVHDVHAYNYRMNNVQAGFLYDQLNDFDKIINDKKRVFTTYDKLLEPLIKDNKIKLFSKEVNTEAANWIYSLQIIGNNKSINETSSYFANNNVDIRPFFYPITSHKHLAHITYNDNIASILNKEIIMIPSSMTITYEEQLHVINILKGFLGYIDTIPELGENQNLEKIFTNRFTNRNILVNGAFDLIPKDHLFTLDNMYYEKIRENITNFIQNTICKYDNNFLILEIGPKQKMDERLNYWNVNGSTIETVDIVENNTTYIADLTKDNNIPKNRFNVIYCLEVIEHTYEPWEMLKQLYDLLSSGGVLHISLPYQFRLHGPLPDCYRISEYGIKYLLDKYNFKILEFNALIDNDRPAFPIHYTITCTK
jgi:perosamine synthetase